jgi:hypothetical protein
LLAVAPTLLLFSRSVAAAQPMLLPDHAADTSVVSPAVSNQDQASIAFGGGVYLAVWRSQPNASPHSRVFATRVNAATGTAIDPVPFLVAGTDTPIDGTAVAFDGTNFVIAWQQQVGATGHILTSTMSPTGMPSAPVDQTTGATLDQKWPAIAAGNGQALLVWVGDATARIHGRILSSVSPIDRVWPQPHTYRTPQSIDPSQDSITQQLSPSVAFGNGRFLVGFVDAYDNDGPDIYAGPVLSDGTVGAPQRVPTDTPGNSLMPVEVSIGFGGGVFLVAYQDFVVGSSGDRDIWARMFDGNGAPTGSAFAVTTHANEQRNPQVSFGGGSFLVAWEDVDPITASKSDITGNQISTTGTLLRAEAVLEPYAITTSPLLPDDTKRPSAIASNGTDFVISWVHKFPSGTKDDVLGSPVTSANIAAAPTPGIISRGPNQEQNLAAASNGSLFLVVWEDTRSFLTSGVDIYGIRVGPDGTPMDAAAFPIATGPDDQTSPAVAGRAGGDFLVTWIDPANAGDIHAIRVSAAGATTGSDIAIATGTETEDSPAVAASPAGWLVAWHDNVVNAPVIKTVRIASNGTLGTVQTVSDPATVVNHPAVAYDGTDFLVVYEQQQGTAAQQILGAWVAEADGMPTGMKPTIASGTINLELPAAAGSMGRTFVAWHQHSTTAGNEVINGTLIPTNAAMPLQATVGLADLASARNVPRVAMTGTDILVGWTDSRSAAIGPQAFAGRVRIVQQPTISLTALDPTGYPTVDGATPPPSTNQALAMMPDGRSLYAMVQQVFVNSNPPDPEPANRVHVRGGGIRGMGDSCTDDGGCDSGHCVANVCCESACNGICQTCASNGHCNVAPQDDSRCAMTDCSSLATECVDYAPMARCEAFGVCRLPGDPDACVGTPKADGTACTAVGCTAPMGMCSHGACVCQSFQPGPSSPNVSPEFANPGCAVAGGSSNGAGWLFALMIPLLALRRRRWLAAVAVFLFGCTSDPGGLIVQVDLTGQASRVDHVRFILTPTSAPGFPAMTMSGKQPSGVTVYTADVGNDGIVDEIVDVDKAYIRGDTLSVELTPNSGGAFGVGVRAWAIDGSGNRFASAPAQNATVKPGETPSVRLALACLNPNCGPTAEPTPAVQPFLGSTPPTVPATGIATGRIKTGSHADDVVVGFPGSPPGTGSTVLGEVHVFIRPTVQGVMQDVVLTTGTAADRFGAAVATGTFKTAGTADVIIGAPGASGSDGAIYVVQGGDWTSAPALGTPIAGMNHEQLGSALAVVDVDSDGAADVVAGAPFGQSVYVFRNGKATLTIHEDAVTGFGSAVAATKGAILVGAPEANRVRLYTLTGATPQLSFEWTASTGGFGAQVALADVDGDGRLDLIASAPAEGAGVVYVLRASDLSGNAATTANGHSAALRATQPGLARLGAQLALLPSPRGFGDALVLGAPGTETNAYAVEGATLVTNPFMAIDAAMAPVAARMKFPIGSSQTNVPLATGDIDGDGAPDIVSVTTGGVQIVKGVAW